MKRNYERHGYLAKLEGHLKIPSAPIQVVLGPRQVGKTTAIRTFLGRWRGPTFYHTADQVSPPDAGWIEEQWIQARKKISGKATGLVVFDEVQKIPRWSEVVKKCFDEDRFKRIALRVVLLGSSSLLVQRGLTESLAGRFEIIRFPHWSFKECQECFGISFDQYVFYGGYPGALKILIDSNWDDERWRTYVQNALIETVLSKDILLLTPVTKPALFRQVFALSCMHPSEIFSLNKMLGQLQEAGNASTIASYLRLLDAAMLLKPIEKYSGNRLRQKTSSPKLVLLNNALINASAGRTFKEAKNNRTFWGRLIENVVGASLINNNSGGGVEVFYWRERNQEVDFVIRYGGRVLAIEVTSSTGRGKENLEKHPFLKRFPQAEIISTQVSGGDIPVEELISMPSHEILLGQKKNQ